ncbi:MAG: virulence RhuM family protein [Phycisphaerales bacterium JB065]
MPDDRSESSTPNLGMVPFRPNDGENALRVRLEGETVWLTQAQMAEMVQTTEQNISLRLKNIFSEHELEEDRVVKNYLTTAADGKDYVVLHYSLDAILAVGYRVRSTRGTQFRQWATTTLSEYLTKGFVMDDDRLKEGRSLGRDYFDGLLERIRDIRASEPQRQLTTNQVSGRALHSGPDLSDRAELKPARRPVRCRTRGSDPPRFAGRCVSNHPAD